MSKKFRTVCPLDCFDSCSWLVTVENDKVTQIQGDIAHPQTKGFICSKANKQLRRVYSIDRVKYPLRKSNQGWQKISWEEAYSLIIAKLKENISQYGLDSILHLYGDGSNGILNTLDQRFFNALGGVSEASGCLCWSAGVKAQELDFGEALAHSWDDLVNSKTIFLWGRDPAKTNIHLVPYLLEAKKNGAKIIVINPIKVASTKFAHEYISIRPGTDGALVLGMMYIILQKGWMDLDFIKKYVHGFKELVHVIKNYPPEKVSKITDISEDTIEHLARLYAISKPSTILVGYGVQRYTNGGQTIRALDALGAITGNIGVPGGGVNYKGSNRDLLLKSLTGEELARKERRKIPWPIIGKGIQQSQEPPIKMIFVTRCNPILQGANTEAIMQAFNQVDFKVCLDLVLTDTAEKCDLFLPVTTIFEEENLIAPSWNYYIHYAPKIIEPLGQCKTELEIFTRLAEGMGIIDKFQRKTATEWIEEILEPANVHDISLEKLRQSALRNPLAPTIAWRDRKFTTPSGKIEVYSEKAKSMGINPSPDFILPRESTLCKESIQEEFPYHFLTIHPDKNLNSQFATQDLAGDLNEAVFIHPQVAEKLYLKEGNLVIVESPRGQVRGRIVISKKIRPDVVVMYQGNWLKNGGGVNFLTPAVLSDIGECTPYYDCLCNIRKIIF